MPAAGSAAAAVADADPASLRDHWQEVVRPPQCLIATEVLYFGVGGSMCG